jgi:hypothetical protein
LLIERACSGCLLGGSLDLAMARRFLATGFWKSPAIENKMRLLVKWKEVGEEVNEMVVA